MAKTNNEYVLIAGSISKNTEKQYIDRAHSFVRTLTKSILDANVGLVVYLAGEPVNENGDLLTFDWTVVNEAEKLMGDYAPEKQLRIVTSRSAMREKMSESGRRLIRKLQADNYAEVSYLEDDLITGGNIGDEQVDAATAMVALGGGKGVSDRANKMRKANHPVLPFDLNLGGICDDGQGALGLHDRFFREPLALFPCTGEDVKKRLDTLSLQEPCYELGKLSEIAVELLKTEWAAQQSSRSPDVLILTALPVELAAAKKAFDIADDIPPCLTSNGIHFWSGVIQRSDGPITCILASFAGAGNVNASAITTSLLSEFKPKKVMMMGIAAGLRGKMALGEVIVSDRVVYYESAAAVEGGKLAPRPEILRPHMSTQQNLNTYLAASSLSIRLGERAQIMGLEMPLSSQAGNVAVGLTVSPATIASGELLIRDPALQESFRSLHDKAYVAEMEAYGVFDACEKQRVPALIVRGISDFGDGTKDDAFHSIASLAAAIITSDYLIYGWQRA
ncbi:purine phosphorylase [Citrobacter portucalensis]|uniref:phosphorylase family protein n=1 Tax=Citrobacter portucalensis TaxID=1639133 RepID=UPI00226B8896|nr:purine phosphorylase [Citrobacter portucalensis]MCX8980859.1 purine phosphorylase [Citrobacter portucalensis]